MSLEKPARRGDRAGFQFGKFWGKNFRPANLRLSSMFPTREEIVSLRRLPHRLGGAGFRTVRYRRPVQASIGDCEVVAPAPEIVAHHDRYNTDDVSVERDRASALFEMPNPHDAGADIACRRGSRRTAVRMSEMRPRRNNDRGRPAEVEGGRLA